MLNTCYNCIKCNSFIQSLVTKCHLCLDQQDSMDSDFSHKLVYVEIFLSLHSLKHAVQHNKCPSSAHSSTAVDQQGSGVRHWMSCPHSLNEIDEYYSILRHPVVRPTHEMKLSHLQWRYVS